jgi:hypothetical protein
LKVKAIAITIVNYGRKTSIVQATGRRLFGNDIFFFKKCNSLTKHGTWSMDDSWKWRKSSKKDCSAVMPTMLQTLLWL